MKTKFLLVALMLSLGGAFVANAQLTTGTPSAKVIRTGNRAKAGDFGIYLGATTEMFKDILNEGLDITPLPLINFKYMSTNNFELRVGLEAYRKNTKVSGEQIMASSISQSTGKNSEGMLTLYPGFAYHFSKLNILDIYVGAELPIGWDASTVKGSSSVDGTAYNYSTTKRSFVLGLGAFIGLQAYIADLPLALGVEYGLSSRIDTGLKYKNVISTNTQTTTTYTTDISLPGMDTQGVDFSKLSARKGEIGGQVRLTLSYYFK